MKGLESTSSRSKNRSQKQLNDSALVSCRFDGGGDDLDGGNLRTGQHQAHPIVELGWCRHRLPHLDLHHVKNTLVRTALPSSPTVDLHTRTIAI